MPDAGRMRGRGRACAAWLAALLVSCAAAACAGAVAQPGAAPDSASAPRYFPPLERLPLDPPLGVTGSFGEYRTGHFHAGLDFSTGERVGRPVFSSLPGCVVRVRASGVGYGRSIYVQADDGRLLVYGHLDAYDGPLAVYVDSVQAATGEYEQDLWPAPGRFRCAAGQRLGWSGRSGTDDPHLHFEIRRGDVAYNPLLAGLSIADTVAPVIRSVTLDPAGPGSFVDGRVVPLTKRVAGAADTFRLAGAARILVEALDARANGLRTMTPWRVRVTDGADWIECRFDSVSWAEGMEEGGWVWDRGLRALGTRSALLWGTAGFHSRVERAGGGAGGADPWSLVAGAPRAVRIEAEDVVGNRASCEVVLAPAAAPDGVGLALGPARDSTRLAALDRTWPGPAGGRRAHVDGGHKLVARGAGGVGAFKWYVKEGTFFDDGGDAEALGLSWTGHIAGAGELAGTGGSFTLHPVRLPVRTPFRITAVVPRADRRLGLYRDDGDGWEWIGADYDSATRTLGAETRRLGRFALLRDTRAPRVTPLAPPARPPAGDYPRWALEARVAEEGSGVAARASYFVVDGRRVPSEWDAVARTLRWRPLRAPARGRHAYATVVTDRAGNARRRHGSFVLD